MHKYKLLYQRWGHLVLYTSFSTTSTFHLFCDLKTKTFGPSRYLQIAYIQKLLSAVLRLIVHRNTTGMPRLG